MNNYIPELGQMCFGCSWFAYACPEFVTAGLAYLAEEIERVEWNRTQTRYEAPTKNNGESYETETFTMRAYDWDADEPQANFRCGDFAVCWYKYLGRGMSMNRKIDANEFYELIQACLASVRKRDTNIFMEGIKE